jgi:FkbM family methyltransferase
MALLKTETITNQLKSKWPILMLLIKSTLTKIIRLIPNKYLKYNIRCFYYNHILKPTQYHVYYKNNSFEFKYKSGITIVSFYDILVDASNSIPGYIANYKLKEGDIVVDCGAYVGAFTLYAAKVVGFKGTVIAFEPDPLNYEKLLSNISLNNLTNVSAINKGVWSQNTILAFNDSHNECAHVLLDNKAESKINVPVVSLDSELETLGIHRVDFIKMDVEGAEIEALKGAVRVLEHNDIHLAIASYHEVDGKPTSSGVESLLTSNNYRAMTSFPRHPTTYAEKFYTGLLAI